MKSIIALGVGLVVALAPGGTAFADVPAAESSTGNGKAYGNCQHSSAGGDTVRLVKPEALAGHGKGNGGWASVAKEPGYVCGVVFQKDGEDVEHEGAYG